MFLCIERRIPKLWREEPRIISDEKMAAKLAISKKEQKYILPYILYKFNDSKYNEFLKYLLETDIYQDISKLAKYLSMNIKIENRHENRSKSEVIMFVIRELDDLVYYKVGEKLPRTYDYLNPDLSKSILRTIDLELRQWRETDISLTSGEKDFIRSKYTPILLLIMQTRIILITNDLDLMVYFYQQQVLDLVKRDKQTIEEAKKIIGKSFCLLEEEDSLPREWKIAAEIFQTIWQFANFYEKDTINNFEIK